jgi:SpoVK/Ycf46/Vps4 family AAA+-type ATPase
VLVVGATNRPQELDEAARRRLVKKLYIPLPDYASRLHLMHRTMSKEGVDHQLTPADFDWIVRTADGYSGSDMAALCGDAAMGPIRELNQAMAGEDDLANMNVSHVRPIQRIDFESAFRSIRPSVNQKDLDAYIQWNVSRSEQPFLFVSLRLDADIVPL